MAKIQVRLFGPTTVVMPDGTTLTDFGGARPRHILAILAAAVGTTVSKDRLVDRLWEGTPPRTCTDTVESYIALLRRRIGVSSGRKSPLATRSSGYLLDADQVAVDLDTFRALVRTAGDSTPHEALDRTDSAVRLASGPLLASEPYADWAVHERDRFRTEYVRACNRAASRALEVSRPHQAVEVARRAIGYDPMSETSWQFLIRGLTATGARSEALRAYLDLRQTLVQGLDTEPSPTSQALYASLLAEDAYEPVRSTRVQEVRTLLALLRDALDTCPNVDLSARDRHLTEQAERLLAVA
jgi:DNA-binding SARP family transcriptional activator